MTFHPSTPPGDLPPRALSIRAPEYRPNQPCNVVTHLNIKILFVCLFGALYCTTFNIALVVRRLYEKIDFDLVSWQFETKVQG